jgi:hypothetical protein
MTKHQQAKAGPFARNEQELVVQNNVQSIIGPYVDKKTQENLEKLFTDVMFPEEE